MNFDNFQQDCLYKKCNRKTFISKQCEKDLKIKNCYKKYLLKLKKDKIKSQKKINQYQQKQQDKRQQLIEDFAKKKKLYLKGDLQDLYGYVDQVDEKLLEVYKKVDKRDKFQCVVWNTILTLKEQKYILENFYEEFKYYGKILDHAHIESISSSPEKKYDIGNIVVMSRFFHTRYDSHENILTGKPCSKEVRKKFEDILKNYILNIN